MPNPTRICERCHLAHPALDVPGELVADHGQILAMSLESCIAAQAKAMLWVLEHVGKKGTCDGPNCRAAIYWVTHTNGRQTPYTEAGLNHFVDCPARDQFARKKE